MQMRFLALIAGFAFIAGCFTSVPIAPEEQDRRAKQFQPSPGTGLIYIYQGVDFPYGMGIRIGNIEVGNLSKDTFLFAEVSPGSHVVFADTKKIAVLRYPVRIEVEEGRTYFISFTWEAGWTQNVSSLDLVSPEEGRNEVNQRDLARLYPVGIVRALPINIVD
jgi:hypothetical protein